MGARRIYTKKAVACALMLAILFLLCVSALSIQLFASPNYTVNEELAKENFKTLDAENLLKSSGPTVYNSKNSQVFAPDGTNNSFSYLTDGLTFANKHIDIWNNTAGLTIAYDLKGRVEIEKAWVLGYTASAALYLGEYNLYVSDAMETLFSDDNKAAEYKYESGAPDKPGQEFTFSAKPSGRFFGIKIITPTRGTDTIIRLDELGVAGRSLETKPYGISPVLEGIGKNYLAGMPSENLLKGLAPAVKGYDASYTYNPDAGKDLKSWADGHLFDGKHIDLNCSSSELRDAYISYDLGYRASIEHLFVSNMYSASQDYGLADYSWYVSDTQEDLFHCSNRVYRYQNTGYWSAQSYDGGAQDVVVNAGKLAGRFVGLRVVKPNNTDKSIRIESVGVFGKEDVDYETVTQGIDQTYIQSMGENLLKNRLPEAFDADGGKLSPDGSGALSPLTDGNVYNQTLTFSGKTTGMTVRIDSGKNMTVNKVLVVSGELDNVNRAPAEYRIFVAERAESLFDPGNRRAAYKTAAVPAAPGRSAQAFLLENPAQGRYVGLQIVTPNNLGGAAVVLDEIGVFGSYTALPDYYVKTEDLTPADIAEAAKKNLLKGLTPVVKYSDGTQVKDLDTGKWTDGVAFAPPPAWSHPDIYGKTTGLTITYTLPERIEVSGFILANHAADFGNYAIGQYEVYLSKYIDTLYNPQNMIAEFDNRGRWQPPYTASSQEFIFEKKSAGYFLGVRVLVPNETDDAVRIDEIVLYGKLSPYVASPVNLLEDMPVNAALTDSAGKSAPLSAADFTYDMQKNILKESNTTAYTFRNQGKTLDFVVDLCRQMELDSFHITGGNFPGYSLYLSDYEEDVWEKSALFATVSNTAQPFVKEGKGRFVRFSIPAGGLQSINVRSLIAVGMDDQRLEKVNQLFNMKTEDILFFRENKESFGLEEDFNVEKAAALVDNNLGNYLDYWGAAYGKENLNIVFRLGGVKSLDEIVLLTALGDPQNLVQPKKLEIYIEDTLDSLFGARVKPVAAYQFKSSDSGRISIRFPHTQGRYLRIAVQEGVDSMVSRGSMMAVFREIQAMGITVMNVLDPGSEKGVARTFTDKTHGLKVEVLGLDDNDTFSLARTMKIERIAPAKAQIEQLMENWIVPYKHLYRISFYSVKGEPVTDFGEREIRMTFKIPAPLLERPAYLACDSEDGMIVLAADYTDTEIVYTLNPGHANWNFAIATGMDEDIDWRVPGAPDVSTGGTPGETGDSPGTGDSRGYAIPVLILFSLFAGFVFFAKYRKGGHTDA